MVRAAPDARGGADLAIYLLRNRYGLESVPDRHAAPGETV